jgi:hypothetical protein
MHFVNRASHNTITFRPGTATPTSTLRHKCRCTNHNRQITHLSLIAQDPEWHGVWHCEWQQLEVESCFVKLEVDAAVGAHWWVGKALAKQRQPRATPAMHHKCPFCLMLISEK